jgi:hypothetical protein
VSVCQIVEAAAAVNRTAMFAPTGYSATIETETATLGRREGRIEGATTIEQTSSRVQWSNDGGFVQHVVGSRSFPNAIPLSRLAFLRIGWVVPTLAGARLQVIARSGPGQTRFDETLRGPMAPDIVVHPLSEDRDRFYRYAGGTPARRIIDGQERNVLAVEVIPVSQLAREETLFEGEMDLDAESNAVLRLIGRIKVVGRVKRGGFMNLPDMFEPTVTLVELVNRRMPDGSWIPSVQRFEIQTASSLASGSGAARRVISRFHDAAPLGGGGGPVAIAASTSGYLLSSASNDSLRGFRGWHAAAGKATGRVAEADFSRWRPARRVPTGRPQLLIQGLRSGDFFRLNRVEGPFTGLSLIEEFRDAAPGLSLRATAGYAWSEERARGAAGVAWQSGGWTMEGGAARSLDVTNKFRNQFDNPALGALMGRDPWDYLEREGGGGALTRSLGGGSIARVEFARVSDNAVSRHMNSSLSGGRLRVNRNITEGSYWRTRAVLDWHPEVSPLFAKDGIGFRGEVESGSGDLDYTRVEGRLVLRKSVSRVFFIARLHAGAVVSDAPPPQQLFELGGPAGLPGYEYKEFAGTRAVLFRARLSYPVPLLDLPLRLGSGVTLPSLAPAISIGFQGGFTDANDGAGLDAVRSLGDKRDEKTGEILYDPNGLALPAAVASDKFRTSVDIRMGFFGDALAVGFARALEKGRKTRFIFAFGRQF